MSQPPSPGRAGIVKTLTLDVEAIDILNAMPIGQRTQGRYISRLILEDQVRREAKAKLRATIDRAMEEVLT